MCMKWKLFLLTGKHSILNVAIKLFVHFSTFFHFSVLMKLSFV